MKSELKNFIQRICTAVIFLITFQSCTSLNKEICMNTDWKEIGVASAEVGAVDISINSRANGCKRFDISPNINDFKAGVKKGLEFYCSPSNASDLGRNRVPFNYRLCPKNAGQLQHIYSFAEAYEIQKDHQYNMDRHIH